MRSVEERIYEEQYALITTICGESVADAASYGCHVSVLLGYVIVETQVGHRLLVSIGDVQILHVWR